jgi:TolB-like protein/DNA-binding winged helix-turn-helix (wHTH) protein/Tfp pilus assembly protein PilF
MAVEVSRNYILGEFCLAPAKRSISRAGVPIPLANRPFRALLYLVENRDRVVTRAELIDQFWEGKDVYDVTLTQCVAAIRRALDDRSESPQFIQTRWTEGYRYIGPFDEQLSYAEPALSEPALSEIERIRGIRVIVEEEIHEPASDRDLVDRSSIRRLPLTRSKILTRTVAVAAAGVLAAVTLAFVITHRGRTGVVPVSAIRSVAILPLRDLTGDTAQEYFSDGLTESLISELSKIDGLRVIPRSSVFAFKDMEINSQEISKRLKVTAVLEGSVRKSGDRVRVDVRLVSADDAHIIWASDTYDRSLGDIFAIQDEIGCGVAANLKTVFCEGRVSPTHYTKNTEAYQLYLKGLYFWNKRTGEGIKKSIECYDHAVAVDPNYALAYAGMAESYIQGIWHVPFEPKTAILKAREAAKKAIELDESLAEAHVALANVYALEWNRADQNREIERAIDLRPDYARARHTHAFCLSVVGSHDRAIEEIKRAEELDPLNLAIGADVGQILYFARRYDECIEQCRKTLEMDPNYEMAHRHLGLAYLEKGMHEEAVREFEKLELLTGPVPATTAWLITAYTAAGKRPEARKLFEEMKAASSKGYVSPTDLAVAYMALGDNDRSMAMLEKAYQEHSPGLVDINAPWNDSLRSDPRFADLIKRLGLSPPT